MKQSGERNELLATGYARSHAIKDIPLEIIQICMAFFVCIDQWDMENNSKWFTFSGPFNQICTCTNPDPDRADNYQTVLGSLSVSSGKHHWRFKLTSIDLNKPPNVRIMFGIVMINEIAEHIMATQIKQGYLSCLAGKFHGISIRITGPELLGLRTHFVHHGAGHRAVRDIVPAPGRRPSWSRPASCAASFRTILAVGQHRDFNP